MVVLLVKSISILLCFVFLVCNLSVLACAGELNISAQSAIVMVASTGEIAYAKNHMQKRGIASTTKIMTSIIALENASHTTVATAMFDDVNVEGTSVGLKAGDTIDLLSLVKCMLLESGNDAANVTATLVGGDRDKFSVMMNKKAKEIGMYNSSFKNPSGLTQEEHYSCAYDMALLGCYAIKNKIFREICSSERDVVTISGTRSVSLYNHNKLLRKYEGALGIKTGFTKASGRCLVSAVEKDGIILVAVTLNAYDDWNDHIKLYDYCFGSVSRHKVTVSLGSCDIPVINSSKKVITPSLSSEFFIPYIKSVPEYKLSYYIPHFVYCGLKKGDYVGWIEIKNSNGVCIGETYLVSPCDLPCINNIEKDCR